jgi:thiamine biosynthesis protein ThiS
MVPEGTNVLGLLTDLKVNRDTVVVELDRIILKKDEYDSLLHDGAVVEIIRFVGGG